MDELPLARNYGGVDSIGRRYICGGKGCARSFAASLYGSSYSGDLGTSSQADADLNTIKKFIFLLWIAFVNSDPALVTPIENRGKWIK